MGQVYPLLALDLATTTGFAELAAAGAVPISGSHRVAKAGTSVGEFLATAERWLDIKIERLRPAWVIYEAPILPQTTSIETVRKLHGLANEVDKAGLRHGCQVREVNGGEVLAHFLGQHRPKRPHYFGTEAEKGRQRADYRKRSKQAVVDACRRKGWNPVDDDEADALAVLDFAIHLLDPEQTSREFALTP